MKRKAYLKVIIAIACVAFGVDSSAQLIWTGPTFPAPGGNTWSGSGAGTINPGGKTWTLENFDLGASDELYYGLSVLPSLGVNSPGSSMVYSGSVSNLFSGVSLWSGSINIPLATGGSTTRDTRFTLSVTDLAGTPLSLIDSSTLSGFPSSQMGLLNVTDPAGFKANWLFEIADAGGTSYQAAQTVYDNLATIEGNTLSSSVGGGFWSTEVIPEPATMGLMTVLGIGVWGVRRIFPKV
jgi:hypothetical protein